MRKEHTRIAPLSETAWIRAAQDQPRRVGLVLGARFGDVIVSIGDDAGTVGVGLLIPAGKSLKWDTNPPLSPIYASADAEGAYLVIVEGIEE